ncbi:MAG: alcohol dehydrogenase catalytic domain-containing protein [Thermoproteus sp.]
MKAYLVQETNSEFKLVEVEKPRPGPGRALVRIKAAGVCYRDYLAWTGWQRVKFPTVPGHEFAGIVEEVGEGSSVRPGDRVAGMMYEYCGECEYCRSGREYLCRNRKVYGEDIWGAFAEYIVADSKSLVRIPDGVDFAAASFAACVLSTLVRAAKKTGIAPGQLVVVTGASGGVGIHALQVAKAYGARVVGVTKPEKAEQVSKYADHVVTTREFADEVKKMGYADVVIETVGGPTIGQSARALKPGGKIALIGNVDPNPHQVQLGLYILKEIDVLPVLQGTRADLAEALRLIADGKIKPVYTLHKFDELPRLVAEMPKARHIGRQVVEI